MSEFEFTDEELIAKFQKGDVGAFNQIVLRIPVRDLILLDACVCGKRDVWY